MLKLTTWLLLTIIAISTANENICLKLIRSRLGESELIEELGKNMHIIKNEANR